MQMEKTISPGSVLRWVFQKTIRLAKGFVPRMTEFGFVLPVSEIPCGQGFPWFSDLFLLVLSSVCEHVEPWALHMADSSYTVELHPQLPFAHLVEEASRFPCQP